MVLVSMLASCTGDDDTTTTDPDTPSSTDSQGHGASSDVPVTVGGIPVTEDGEDTEPTVLGLRLSEGRAETDPAQLLTRVDGTPLTPEEIAAVLARMPEWSVPGDDVEHFNRPADTLKPPLVGDAIATPFPP
jgi:hypothetical protein